MLSKASRFRYWLVGLVLAVVVAVGVVVAVDAFADIGAGGSDRPCVGECNEEAWPIWRFGSWASTDEFISSEKNDTNWDWPSEATSAAKEAYAKALAQCKATDAGGKCNDPVIVAAGYMTILKDGSPSSVASNVINESGADALKSTWSQAYGAQGFDTCHTWLLNSERRVNSCSKMGESASVNTRASQDANYSDSTLVVMVVLSGDDVNTSMTGEDCARIVTGGIDYLLWGPDGLWSTYGSGWEFSSLTTEDSEGNSLKNLQGASVSYIWDATHVWNVDTNGAETSKEMQGLLTLVPGLSGRISGVIDSTRGGTPTVIYGSDGAWLFDEDTKTTVKLPGLTRVNTIVTGGDGQVTGVVFGYALTDDGAWLFDKAGNARKIVDSDSGGLAPSGEITGVTTSSRRPVFYGKNGAWLVWLGSGRFTDGWDSSGTNFKSSVADGSIHVEQITTEEVVAAKGAGFAGSTNEDNGFFYITASQAVKYVKFYYSLAGSNTTGHSDLGYVVIDATGDQLSNVKGITGTGDDVFVWSDTEAWTLGAGSISYQENKDGATTQSIDYAAVRRVPGITGKIIGVHEPNSYFSDTVATTDGIWEFKKNGSAIIPSGVPSDLTAKEGSYPSKGEYSTWTATREPVVSRAMVPGSDGYFIDVKGNPITYRGEKVKTAELTRFVREGDFKYSVYANSRYYFASGNASDATPMNVGKTPYMCYAVDYVVKENDENGTDVTSQTDAPGTQYVLRGKSITLPALNKIPDGWRFDDVWHGADYNGNKVGTVFTPTGDTTFEGYLKPLVHLSFDLNQAKGQEGVSETPATQTMPKGSNGRKPSPDPTWTGRHFKAWYLKNDDGSLGDDWDWTWGEVDQDTTLYAGWQVKQSFDTTVPDCKLDNWQYTDDRTLDYGSKAQSVDDPSCGKYDFAGWVKDSPDSTTVIKDLTTVTLDKDTTFYAKWSPKQVKLSFRKVDADDDTKYLAGAEFTITGGGLSDSLKVTSNDQGMVNFTVPTSDTPYTVTESKAPEGYEDALAAAPTSFKLTIPSGDYSDFQLSDVKCSDGSSSCLSGSAGDFVDGSDDDGPDGYVNNLANSANKPVKLVDHFPQTGRTGSMVFPVVGGLLIILAAFIAWALHRRGHGGVDGSGDSSVPTAPSDSSSASTVSSSVDGLTVGGDPSVVGEVEVPVSHPVDSDL